MAARKLAAYVHIGGRSFAPGEAPPKEYADQITNPNAWVGGGGADDAASSGDGGQESEETPYSKRTKAELQEEIDRRNEGRDDEDLIEPEGTKNADLVAALEADDAATSGA